MSTARSTTSSPVLRTREVVDESTTELSALAPHDALYQVKLLSALRSGDPAQLHVFLTEIGRERRKSAEGDVDIGALALHLAIRCANCDTIQLLLSHRSISPNAVHPPGSGTTALHLAASLARSDVVTLLLDQEGIDDTLRDSNGRTCLEVAKGKDTIHAIKESRAQLTTTYRSLLRAYIHSPPSERMSEPFFHLLSSPRSRLVDLSYLDESSGTTILHEAARRKDLRAIEIAIRAGADIFVRDRKGRSVYDCAGKDDKIKVFLRQFTNQDTSLLETPSLTSEPPEHKGYLNKYTNVAKGYNTRWFVLKNGILSYYRHQDDENVASRGSIAMKTAQIKTTPGSGGLRFEVSSTPARGSNSHPQKWYIKANHPIEASRWLQALNRSIEWAKREESRERQSGESDVYSSKAPSTKGAASITLSRSKGADLVGGVSSRASSTLGEEPTFEGSSSFGAGSGSGGREGNGDASMEEPREGEKESEETSVEEAHSPPYANSFGLQGNATIAQVEMTAAMLQDLLRSHTTTISPDIRSAIIESFGNAQTMLSEYVQMAKERDDWWQSELDKERQRQNIWEESLRAVVKEGEVMEKELRDRSRRRSSRLFDQSQSVSEFGTIRTKASGTLLSPPVAEEDREQMASPDIIEPSAPRPTISPTSTTVTVRQAPLSRQPTLTVQSIGTPLHRPFSLIMGPASPGDAESTVDTDEEDEFFDAIETNTLPNLIINDSLARRPSAIVQLPPIINKEQYVGYSHLRTRLAISSDDRPPMSLWAVLKNSIGKDLTKISFPVFFNEPTSMLQRMAEDMEFSECLDAAAAEKDPHRRIAFVAAFAMSNYSSTIGRIAKPFNPMLSETFEYVRMDKEYRYMSEQVSHHPPISACWAEAPLWRYYGEVDAQNKFMGKSFEIRPTGVAHAELLLPEEQAPTYPKAKGNILAGKVIEHFSWKKVTTNISGFILGSPTIDHYGDMIVTNHRTGDKCVLTFKPRGWRGRDAYEISGYVADVDGNITYEIAGRWNSQLVARQVGTGFGQLHPDVSLSNLDDRPSSPSEQEYILLWRNSQKPPAPFNLTPFAITLNDCPRDTLKPFVCPTDCRLRPDQRAFELGKYERANELKNMQEDYQRMTRRARDEGKLPPHRPRWFTAETEPDTGERVWTPSRVDGERLEYWAEREKIWEAKTAGKSSSWKAVDNIFIDEEP
ncbi:Oxysterol-binding protein-domain-containing protein [Abortiporus biennis]|nr:Oxysterol-binding protein-domain-containing protein [Abortiporus biennis]